MSLSDVLDEDSKKFLKAIQYYGGRATTTEIRQRTGLSRSKANYRFDKLRENDLIEVTRADSAKGNRKPPKVAHLTGQGRKALEKGLAEDTDDPDPTQSGSEIDAQRITELEDKLEELENKINVNIHNDPSSTDDPEVLSTLDSLTDRVDELEATLEAGAGPDNSSIAESPAVTKLDSRVATLENDLTELEDYIYDWTDTTQSFLTAIRHALEDKLDINLATYVPDDN